MTNDAELEASKKEGEKKVVPTFVKRTGKILYGRVSGSHRLPPISRNYPSTANNQGTLHRS